MNKTLKSTLLFFTVLLCNNTYAYNCPQVTNNINVHIINPNPNINYDYSSQQLDGMKGEFHSGKKLGVYVSQINTTVQTKIKYISYGSEVCAVIDELNITPRNNSTIYVARESLVNECTKNRVLNHEYRHHNNKTNSLTKLSQYGRTFGGRITNIQYKGNSVEEVNRQINTKANALNKYISDFIYINSEQYDRGMDSIDNYKKEQSICSQIDNMQLYNALKR